MRARRKKETWDWGVSGDSRFSYFLLAPNLTRNINPLVIKTVRVTSKISISFVMDSSQLMAAKVRNFYCLYTPIAEI